MFRKIKPLHIWIDLSQRKLKRLKTPSSLHARLSICKIDLLCAKDASVSLSDEFSLISSSIRPNCDWHWLRNLIDSSDLGTILSSRHLLRNFFRVLILWAFIIASLCLLKKYRRQGRYAKTVTGIIIKRLSLRSVKFRVPMKYTNLLATFCMRVQRVWRYKPKLRLVGKRREHSI